MPLQLTKIALVLISLALIGASTGFAEARSLLWQTNAGGDDIHIFDVETGTQVKRIVVGANPHGIARAPGGTTVYVSLEKDGESQGELVWINAVTFEVEYRLKVGPEPHALAVTPDDRWIYVPCRDGHYWVVDAQRREVVARIKTGGRPHNTTAAPSGDRVYLSPMGPSNQVTIVDPSAGHSVVGAINFSDSVRPPAIAPSRGLFFQHVDSLNGFEVADLKSEKQIGRVEHSEGLGLPMFPAKLGYLSFSGLNRCHGLSVRPGDREIWSICGSNATIHAIDDDGFPEIAHLELPAKGYWLTFSRNGDKAFIALSGSSQVAVVDTKKREIVRLLKAGKNPKRNLVVGN